MNIKKLKRLLCVTLSASMVLSTNMTGFAAESTTPDQASPVDMEEIQDTQAHEHTWQLSETLKDMGRYVCTIEGCTEAKYDVMPAADNAGNGEQSSEESAEIPKENIVATINGKPYDDIKTAMAELQNGENTELKLEKDVHITNELSYTLAGKTILTQGHAFILDAGANLTLTGATVKNEKAEAQQDPSTRMFYAAEGSALTIDGGHYETASYEIILASGNVTINNGTFLSTSADAQYDATYLFRVAGGTLNIKNGQIKTAGIGSAEAAESQTEGMYGIYVSKGGKLILGENGAGPTIESKHSVIGTNYHTNDPSVSIEIHGGTYKSHVNFDTTQVPTDEKHNTVIYITGESNVAIDGGTFETTHTENKGTHVISIPLSSPYNTQGYRNIAITGGSFTAGGDVFHTEGVNADAQPDKNLVNFDITSGSFSSDISKYTFGKFQCQKNEATGKYEIVEKDSASVAMVNGIGYTSLADAFHNAIEAGKTATAENPVKVELIDNAVLGGSAAFEFKNVAIQTNGHMITIQDGARIQLKDAVMDNKEITEKTDGVWAGGVMLNVLKGSKLVINGGTYTTAGVNMLAVKGNVTIDGNPTFKCTKTDVETSKAYDGAAMFTVSGMDALLTMLSGKIEATAGANTNCGMYGIYVKSDGKIVLGKGADESNPAVGPTIETTFAAVGMNGTQPTASVIINAGTYKSSVNCTAENEKKFNAVLYLSVTSNVVINGGTFEATAKNDYAHVISAPYNTENGQVKLEINDGSFTSQGDIFYWASNPNAKGVVKGGKFSKVPTGFINAQYAAGAQDADGMFGIIKAEHTHKTGKPVDEVSATCQKEGVLFHYECPECHEMFADPGCTVPLTAEEVKIPRDSHDGVYHEAEDATCTTPKHIAYYECKNCGKKYKTIEALKNDAATLTDSELYPNGQTTSGHDLSEYVFNWEDEILELGNSKTITYEKFAAIQDGLKKGTLTVTVKQVCSNKCGTENTDFKGTVSVALGTSSADKVKALDCTKDIELTYIATVTETTEQPPQTSGENDDTTEQEEPTPITRELKVNISKNTAHAYELSVTEKNNQTGTINYVKNQTQFQATRKCKYCTVASGAATELVTVKTEPETDCEKDKQDVELTVTANFGTEQAPDTQNGTVKVNVKATGHNFSGNSYHKKVESTCIKEGSRAFYECQNCQKMFTNPTSSGKELSADDVSAVKKPHNFGLPVCEWENEVVRARGKAKAVFTCLSCSGRVEVSGLEAKDAAYADQDAKYECSDKADLIYAVPVTFNKAYVIDTNTEPDAFGDRRYEYGDSVVAGKEDQDQEITYQGAIREQAVKGHKFEVALSWADETDSDLKYVLDEKGDPVTDSDGNKDPYHDPQKGFIATLTCKDCGGIVTINSTNNKVTCDNSKTLNNLKGVQAASGKVTVEENKNVAGYVENRCTRDGKSFHDAIVTCRTDDGKPQATYPKEGEDPLRVSTTTEKKGHDWYIASSDDVRWEDPNYASYPTQKGDVLVRVKCASDKDHDTTLIGEKAGVSLTEVTLGQDGSGKHGAHALTCTENGVNVWTVSVKVPYGRNGDTITTFEQKTREKESDAQTDVPPSQDAITKGEIFVSKTVTAKGHTYNNPTFNWGGYFSPADAGENTPVDVNKAERVYLQYECTNANCSLKADTDTVRDPDCVNDKGEIYTDEDGNKHWRKKLLATVTDAPVEGHQASCNTSGKVTYTAAVAGKTDIQTKTVNKLGHDWANATFTWPTNPELVAGQTITVEGQTGAVPVYSIKLTRTCQRCQNDEDQSGNTDEITAKLGETADNCIKSKADGAYVLLSDITNQNETCDEGSTGYTRFNATLYNSAGVQQGEPKNYNVTRNGKKHSYNLENVHVDWTTLDEVDEHNDKDNPTLITGRHFEVAAYIPCDAKPSDTAHRRLVKVDVKVQEGSECGKDGGVTFVASISKEETDAAQLKFAAEGSGEATQTVTYSYTGAHNPVLVKASSDTTLNCESPYYPRHWHCDKCGNNYATSAMNNKVDVSFTGRDHVYNNAPAFSWIKEGESAQAVFTCSVCGLNEIIKEAKFETKNEYEKPGCIGTGKKGYTYYAYSVQLDESAPTYEYEFEVEMAPVPHTLDSAGICTLCKQAFVQVVFNRRTGGALQQVFYSREKDGENVVIKDVTGKVITAADIAVPTVPQQTGYEFKGWKFGEETEITSDAIAAIIYTALTTTEAVTITVEPNYVPLAKTAEITVECVAGDVVLGTKIENAEVGQSYSLAAAQELTPEQGSKTYTFSCWASDKAGKTVLSTNKDFQIAISSEAARTIYAIYVEKGSETKPVEVKPIIMSDVYTSIVNGAYKLSFASTRAELPEGCTMVDTGFLYGTKQVTFANMDIAALEKALVLGSATENLKTQAVSGNAATNALTVNLGTNQSNCDMWVCARGYLRYSDADGNIVTAYTDVIKTTYNLVEAEKNNAKTSANK